MHQVSEVRTESFCVAEMVSLAVTDRYVDRFYYSEVLGQLSQPGAVFI